MFIGLPPTAKRSYYHNEFLPEHFLVIALEAAKKLQWRIGKITKAGFSASDIGKSGNTRSKIEFTINGDSAIITSRLASGIIDFGRNATNLRKFDEQLIDLKYDLKPDELNRMWDDLKNELITDVSELTSEGERDSNIKIGFLSVFIPRKHYLVTPILININILLFAIQILSGVSLMEPGGEDLSFWGGNFRPLTFGGQWWRLVTNCFLHIGILHLLMNMYALMYIGIILEPLIGSKRFGYAYLLTGILASVTSVCVHENTISAGASGAIFGMYGVYLALLTTNLVGKNIRNAQLTSIVIFIIYNLAYGMKGGIDNAAHVGGLVSGIIAGFSFYPILKNQEIKRSGIFINTSTLLALTLISVFFISRTDNPIGDYDKILEQFGNYEEKALGVYKLEEFESDEKYLYEIEHNGLPYWIKCKNLVDSAGRVEGLPEILLKQNALLKRYCNYRIESYKLLRNRIINKSYNDQFAINEYNQKIDLIIRKLNGEQIEDSELEIKTKAVNLNHNGIFVVDGYIVDNIDYLNQSDIKNMNVLKGEFAVKIYGEQARQGAVIINTYSGALIPPAQ